MSARKHRWTDEDAAYAAAQWASGIQQREIAVVFGLSTRSVSTISLKIRGFLATYADVTPYQAYGYDFWNLAGDSRKALVKQALAVFVAQRDLEHVQRVLDELAKEGQKMGFYDPPGEDR